MTGFNSALSFRAIQDNNISITDILMEMKNFVMSSHPGSRLLSFIDWAEFGSPQTFQLNAGQRACLLKTIELVIAAVCPDNGSLQSTSSANQSTSSANRRRISNSSQAMADPIFDVSNLQQIVNEKLSAGLLAHGYSHNDFPVVGSSTRSFPYKVVVECPRCKERISIRITADVKNGHKLANFRRHQFVEHFLKCVADENNSVGDNED